MNSTTKLWIAVPLTLGLIVAACSGSDSSDATDASAATAPATTAPDTTPAATPDQAEAGTGSNEGTAPAAAVGVVMLGDEEIAATRVLCYFQEQPRAGLGGVFTHTAQVEGTDAEGTQVLVDLSRAVAEDGTVDEKVIVDIGDPRSDDAVSMSMGGPDGTIAFGDNEVAVDGVEVINFEGGAAVVTLDLACR
jgi:hypothetical protein